MIKTLHKPKVLNSVTGLGLPNTLKTIKLLTNDTLILEETWQDMEKPWTQGNITIAQPGYTWISTWIKDQNYIKTDMFDTKAQLIGTYFDICNSVKKDASNFSFEDWYLDVWKPAKLPAELLDENELEEAINLGYLTKPQYDKALETAKEILEECSAKEPKTNTSFSNNVQTGIRIMLNKLRYIFLGLICLLLIGLVLFQISKSRTFQFFGNLTHRVSTDQKVVALTFDDAPAIYVTEMLNTLNEKQVKATFYVTGHNIETYPNEAKALVDAGMELGNHSYSHKRLIFKSPHFIASEIQITNQLIRNTGYTGEITFRPPNGKKLFILPWYLQQNNIQTIMWDVEPDTYATQLPEGSNKTNFLVSYTIEHTKPGSIILMHPFCESCTSDREALGEIIKGLKTKGYTFVTVAELLKLQEH